MDVCYNKDKFGIFFLSDVYIDFNLLAINVVNEVQETMQTTAFLQMSWADSELQWDPAIYGGIQEALWPQVRDFS